MTGTDAVVLIPGQATRAQRDHAGAVVARHRDRAGAAERDLDRAGIAAEQGVLAVGRAGHAAGRRRIDPDRARCRPGDAAAGGDGHAAPIAAAVEVVVAAARIARPLPADAEGRDARGVAAAQRDLRTGIRGDGDRTRIAAWTVGPIPRGIRRTRATIGPREDRGADGLPDATGPREEAAPAGRQADAAAVGDRDGVGVAPHVVVVRRGGAVVHDLVRNAGGSRGGHDQPRQRAALRADGARVGGRHQWREQPGIDVVGRAPCLVDRDAQPAEGEGRVAAVAGERPAVGQRTRDVRGLPHEFDHRPGRGPRHLAG